MYWNNHCANCKTISGIPKIKSKRTKDLKLFFTSWEPILLITESVIAPWSHATAVQLQCLTVLGHVVVWLWPRG